MGAPYRPRNLLYNSQGSDRVDHYGDERFFLRNSEDSDNEEALREAGVPSRAGVRNDRAFVWEDRHAGKLRSPNEGLMTLSLRQGSQAVWCELVAELLRSQGKLRLRATGRSMLPTIWPGDTLVIERLAEDEVAVGEVVLFARNGRFVAHRVAETMDGVVHTQGDSASRPDAPLVASDLIGKVSMIVRDGKLIQLADSRRAADRALSSLVARSEFAGRVVAGVHKIRLALRKRVLHQATSQPSSRARVSPCQN